MTKNKYKLAIFASGGGSNARCIVDYFRGHSTIEVAVFLTNNPESGVLSLAKNNQIPSEFLPNTSFQQADILLPILSLYQIDYILLAGFLRKIPDELIQVFQDKIINIHPSLLPKFGGKGMYGHKVHEAVKQAGEEVTGCTIHLVNEEYDQGKILAQFTSPVSPDMTPDDIAKSVLALEHRHFSAVIEKYVLERKDPGC